MRFASDRVDGPEMLSAHVARLRGREQLGIQPDAVGSSKPTSTPRTVACSRGPHSPPCPLCGDRIDGYLESAAQCLGTGERFIRRLVAQRRISYVKLGKYVGL